MIKETVFTKIKENVSARIKDVTKEMIAEITANGIQVTSPEFSETTTAKLFALQNVHYILADIEICDEDEDDEDNIHSVATPYIDELVDLLVSDNFQIDYFADTISDVQDTNKLLSILIL